MNLIDKNKYNIFNIDINFIAFLLYVNTYVYDWLFI